MTDMRIDSSYGPMNLKMITPPTDVYSKIFALDFFLDFEKSSAHENVYKFSVSGLCRVVYIKACTGTSMIDRHRRHFVLCSFSVNL